MMQQQPQDRPPMPRFHTDDINLRITPEYQTVHGILSKLWDGGVIQRGYGYCMSMSDMIKVLLEKEGIKSHIVECKLTVMSKDHPQIMLIGHDGLQAQRADPMSMDTHLVVITDTMIPMLIDTAIIGVRQDIPWILEAVTQTDDKDRIGDYDFGSSTWVYERKTQSRLPELHQRSITDRMRLDYRVGHDIRLLKILLSVALVITVLNSARGIYDSYQTYLVDGNYWGPSVTRRILEKLDRMEAADQEHRQNSTHAK